jgi:hypothetical protein
LPASGFSRPTVAEWVYYVRGWLYYRPDRAATPPHPNPFENASSESHVWRPLLGSPRGEAKKGVLHTVAEGRSKSGAPGRSRTFVGTFWRRVFVTVHACLWAVCLFVFVVVCPHFSVTVWCGGVVGVRLAGVGLAVWARAAANCIGMRGAQGHTPHYSPPSSQNLVGLHIVFPGPCDLVFMISNP